MSLYDTRPGRFEPDTERDARIRRGVSACRAALAQHTARSPRTGGDSDDGLTPAHRAARDRARTERRIRGPESIGAISRRLRQSEGDSK